MKTECIVCPSCGGLGVSPGCHYGEHMVLAFELCEQCKGKKYIKLIKEG